LIRKLFRKRIEEILAKFDKENIIVMEESSNFFGQESKGTKQVRGNGVLLLTERDLYFEMWFPKKILKIPVSTIISIDTPKTFLRKSKFRALLKVNFKFEGRTDAAAWFLEDLAKMKEHLEQLL